MGSEAHDPVVVVAQDATVVPHSHAVPLDAVNVQSDVRRDVPRVRLAQARGMRVEVRQDLMRERAAVLQEVALVGDLVDLRLDGHDGDPVRWRVGQVPT